MSTADARGAFKKKEKKEESRSVVGCFSGLFFCSLFSFTFFSEAPWCLVAEAPGYRLSTEGLKQTQLELMQVQMQPQPLSCAHCYCCYCCYYAHVM
jgi:hypothetical protein